MVLLCLTSFAYAGGPGQGTAVRTLVIDPGHGGMDPGAIGPGGHHEAELALGVSLKFGEMVKEAFPDVKIIYTRTTDKFVSLADRADMANKAKADLFICIHLNSATNHEAYGTSTYVLGLHRTDDNLEIAKRENAVIDLETNKNTKYEFDPNSPEGHIIMSMKQNAFLDQSILIASKIEDELAVLAKRKSRGVKQAGFWVLYKTAMPSLLAEIGFISNPTEEQFLAGDAGQTNIATAIYKAFRTYKNQIEGRKDTIEPVAAKAPATPEKKKDEPVLTDTQPSAPKAPAPASQNPDKQPAAVQPKAEQPVAEAKSQPAPAAEAKQQPASTTAQSQPEAKKEEKAWAPDTTDIAPAPQVYREQQATANATRIDQIAKPILRDTIRPAVTSEPRQSAPPHTEVVTQAPKATTPVPQSTTKTVKTAGDTIRKVTTEVKVAAPKPATTTAKAKTDTIKTVQAKEPKAVTKETATTAPKKEQPTTVVAKKETPPAKKETPVVVEKKEPVKKEAPATADKKQPAKKETVKKETAPASKSDALATDNENVIFTVQIIAAHKAPANYDDLVSTFGLINREEIGDGVVRYMAGQTSHYREAEKILQQARSKGFPAAFVICYVNNVRQTAAYTREIGAKHP